MPCTSVAPGVDVALGVDVEMDACGPSGGG